MCEGPGQQGECEQEKSLFHLFFQTIQERHFYISWPDHKIPVFFYEFPYHLFNLSSSHLISLSAWEHSSLELGSLYSYLIWWIFHLSIFITNVNKSILSCFNSYDVAQEKHFMSQFSKYRWENGLFTKMLFRRRPAPLTAQIDSQSIPLWRSVGQHQHQIMHDLSFLCFFYQKLFTLFCIIRRLYSLLTCLVFICVDSM